MTDQNKDADAAFDQAAAAANAGDQAKAPAGTAGTPLARHVAPGARQCPADAPPWLAAAWREIGTREIPDNRGPAIRRYIEMAHCGAEGEAWCAIFANAMLESVGVRGTRSPSSQSFRHDPNFIQLGTPALGAITVFWRLSKNSGLGHVGFYVDEGGGYVGTLGGNEGDMVQIEPLAKAAGTFGLVGYFWPRGPVGVPGPTLGAIEAAGGMPAHQVSVT